MTHLLLLNLEQDSSIIPHHLQFSSFKFPSCTYSTSIESIRSNRLSRSIDAAWTILTHWDRLVMCAYINPVARMGTSGANKIQYHRCPTKVLMIDFPRINATSWPAFDYLHGSDNLTPETHIPSHSIQFDSMICHHGRDRIGHLRMCERSRIGPW